MAFDGLDKTYGGFDMTGEKEIDYDKKLREIQLSLLDKLGSGGLNQNDMMAMVSMMQKQEPNTFNELMPMIAMMKMMNPAPKQDQTAPMFMYFMMENMKKGSGSEVEKKIEKLEEMIKQKEDKKMYEEVMKEIRDMQKNKDGVGVKDILELALNKDKVIEDLKRITNDKDRELLIREFSGQMGTLQEEIKKISGGGGTGSIKQVVDTIKAIKGAAIDLGIDKVGQKSKEEVIKDLIENTTKALAPAINRYVEHVATQQNAMTQAQYNKIQQIQAQRQAQAPPEPANPGPEQGESEAEAPENPAAPYKDEFGSMIYPDLIQVSDSRAGRRARRG